jgi:tryptophan-rich sensory protein
MKKLLLFLAILAVNFGGLAIGGWFTGPGVQSDWYANLPQAPWTPPGWVFGAAWTVVMLGFSWFCFDVLRQTEGQSTLRNRWIKRLTVAWILNVGWNPLFFTLHWVGVALLEIILLCGTIVWLGIESKRQTGGNRSLWGLPPYLIWLCIAISLNAYSAWM